jgi:hypothetical protein
MGLFFFLAQGCLDFEQRRFLTLPGDFDDRRPFTFASLVRPDNLSDCFHVVREF